MSLLETNWNLLSDRVHKAVDKISKKPRLTHAEAFFTGEQVTEVTIRDSEIQSQNRQYDLGVGFRIATSGNKVGYACTNNLAENSIFETINQAFTIAKVSSEIPNFALPDASQSPTVKGLFDSQIETTTVEEAVNIAKRAITSAEDFDERVLVKRGLVVFSTGWRGIINNLGVDFKEKESRAIIYLGGSGQHSGEVTGTCSDIMYCREAKLDPEKVGENVGERVLQMFNKQVLKSFEGTVIFSPSAVSYQLAGVLIDALKGENVASGSSVWAQKLGKQVTSQNLTINDNAILEKGFASRSFDDEGGSSQKTPLIHKGKLETFLHTATSANTLKTQNTANGSRFTGGFDMVRLIVGNSYKAKPESYPSNLVIQSGNKTKEELISETEKGILVEEMAGFPQKGSGLISAQLSRAFFIEKGEIKFPIKGAMVSGIAFDWFKQISGIGKDVKQFQNSLIPSLRVEGVKIIG
ncbi:MAG: TldD/PmbA family protein [Candidatus Hodarchaeota archaeon]